MCGQAECMCAERREVCQTFTLCGGCKHHSVHSYCPTACGSSLSLGDCLRQQQPSCCCSCCLRIGDAPAGAVLPEPYLFALRGKLPCACASPLSCILTKPDKPTVNLQTCLQGQRYWQQERRVCTELAHLQPGHPVTLTLADVLQTHELKSFDYRVRSKAATL